MYEDSRLQVADYFATRNSPFATRYFQVIRCKVRVEEVEWEAIQQLIWERVVRLTPHNDADLFAELSKLRAKSRSEHQRARGWKWRFQQVVHLALGEPLVAAVENLAG